MLMTVTTSIHLPKSENKVRFSFNQPSKKRWARKEGGQDWSSIVEYRIVEWSRVEYSLGYSIWLSILKYKKRDIQNLYL